MEKEIIITPEIEEQNIDVIAEQGVFPTGTIYINENGITDVSNYATANVDVDFNLQDKDVSITQNGTDIITADEGYMGMSSVNINTNVPAPKYAPSYIRFQNYTGYSLQDEVDNLDTSNMTSFENMFYGCNMMTTLDISHFDTSKVTTAYEMLRYCNNLTTLKMPNFENLQTANGMFRNSFASSDVSLDLSGITSTKLNNCNYMFSYCRHLAVLDISGIDLTKVTMYSGMFQNCGTNTANGLTMVYVKDQASQNWLLALSGDNRPSNWTTANVIIKS